MRLALNVSNVSRLSVQLCSIPADDDVGINALRCRVIISVRDNALLSLGAEAYPKHPTKSVGLSISLSNAAMLIILPLQNARKISPEGGGAGGGGGGGVCVCVCARALACLFVC